MRTGTLQIRTPDGIVFSLLLAGPVTRFLAAAIDLACLMAASSLLGSALAPLQLVSSDVARAVMILAFFIIQIGYGIVAEWNGAISDARFVDDAGNPVAIRPRAWQIALNYQFDWNPTVETIGTQGTYLTMGYSESSDLFGVTRIVDPLNPVPERVGTVPERRFSIGIGEWVLDGCRVAFEYAHDIDYSVADGGTGNSADAVLMQWTYEW